MEGRKNIMKKISILIPVYNVEKYIEQTIKSVLEQTYTNFELILLDDGSTDKSIDVIRKYEKIDKRIKYITRENKGVLETRIELIKAATGDYSMFLDADDWIDKITLENMYKEIAKDDCDVVRCNKVKEIVNENRKIYMPHFNSGKEIIRFEEFPNRVYPYFINTYICNSVVAQLIKTEYLKDVRINTKVSMAEDLNFNLDLYNKIKSIKFMEDYYYHYRYNDNSITTQNISRLGIDKKVDDVKFVYSQLLNYIKKWNIDTEDNRKIIMKRIINEMLICTRQFSKVRDIKLNEIVNFIQEKFEKDDIREYMKNIEVANTDNKLFKLLYAKKYKKMARNIKYNIYFEQCIKNFIKKVIYRKEKNENY